MSLKVWGFLTTITQISMLAAFLLSYFMGGCTDVFTVSDGVEVYMSCRYAFVAVAWISIIGFVASIFLMRTTRPQVRKNLIIIIWVCVIAAVLMTTSFGIGVCEDAAMPCHLTALGVYTMLVIVAAATAYLFVNANKEVITPEK